MPTLGDQLKANIRNQSDAEERAEAARRAQAAAVQREIEAKVKGFLTRAQTHIAGAIEAGDKPRPIRIDHSSEFDSYRWPSKPDTRLTFADVMPEFRSLTQDFDRWMADNGLAYSLVPDHDGVGVHSWHNLVVRPA